MSEQDEVEIPTEVNDSPHFKNLRKQNAALQAERDQWQAKAGEYRGLLVKNAVELAGFKPGDDGSFAGMAGLLVEKFTSSLTDDVVPSKDSFAALAEQYGVKPEGAPAVSGAPSAAAELERLQAPGDLLRQTATIPEPASDLITRIREAEAAGDVPASMALKAQLQRERAA